MFFCFNLSEPQTDKGQTNDLVRKTFGAGRSFLISCKGVGSARHIVRNCAANSIDNSNRGEVTP